MYDAENLSRDNDCVSDLETLSVSEASRVKDNDGDCERLTDGDGVAISVSDAVCWPDSDAEKDVLRLAVTLTERVWEALLVVESDTDRVSEEDAVAEADVVTDADASAVLDPVADSELEKLTEAVALPVDDVERVELSDAVVV